MQHINAANGFVLENISELPQELKSSAFGRSINVGHSIETCALWIRWCVRLKMGTELQLALKALHSTIELAWDSKYGGLMSFLDSEGYSPVQIEWSSKMWWVHAEALLATLLAFKISGERKFLDSFERLKDYTFAHFPDSEHGEWFGYLDRTGEMSQRFKGGAFKGCCHVPKVLLEMSELTTRTLEKH